MLTLNQGLFSFSCGTNRQVHKKPLGQVSWTIQGFQRISCSGYKLGEIVWEGLITGAGWDEHQSMGGEQLCCAPLYPGVWSLLLLLLLLVVVVLLLALLVFFFCFQLLNCSYLYPWVLLFFSLILLPIPLWGWELSRLYPILRQWSDAVIWKKIRYFFLGACLPSPRVWNPLQ